MWELLQKLISWRDLKTTPVVTATFQAQDINAVIASNAAAAQSIANAAINAAVSELESHFEQTVTIYAEFPNATDQNEIVAAFDNMPNEAAQYANRKY